MKILLFSDVHWSTYTSIVRTRGAKYSTRLEYLIKSLNWTNKFAVDQNCSMMICAGDFFDKAIITDEEATALKDITWNNLPKYFLCGNHESSVNDLRFNALKVLEEKDSHIISSTGQCLNISNICNICFLPYITETNRHNLKEYLPTNIDPHHLIVISHNDIAGINYGGFVSKSGFSVEEIEHNCELFFNGHLHNSAWISNKVLNLGSMTAHNFTNDSFKYEYGVWIFDTDTFRLTFFENPFSLNFYQLEALNEADLDKDWKLKNNAVLSIKCSDLLVSNTLEKLKNYNIIDKRFIVETSKATLEEASPDIQLDTKNNYLQQLIDYCNKQLEHTQILEEELTQICQ